MADADISRWRCGRTEEGYHDAQSYAHTNRIEVDLVTHNFPLGGVWTWKHGSVAAKTEPTDGASAHAGLHARGCGVCKTVYEEKV